MAFSVMCGSCGTVFDPYQWDDHKCPKCNIVVAEVPTKKIGVKEIIIVHGLNARAASIQASIDGMKAAGGYSEVDFLEYGKDLEAIAEAILKIADGIADDEE